jgi:hypothetical protein
MHRLALLAIAVPVVVTALLPRDPDPAFGVACGAGLEGVPQEVVLHAGQHSPVSIRVSILPLQTDPTAAPDSSMRLEVVSGSNSGSCSTTGPAPFHVYLNTPSATTVAITVRSAQPVIFRGVRGETQRSSVEVNAGTAGAGLTW